MSGRGRAPGSVHTRVELRSADMCWTSVHVNLAQFGATGDMGESGGVTPVRRGGPGPECRDVRWEAKVSPVPHDSPWRH